MGRKMISISMAVAGAVAIVTTADLVAGLPFGQFCIWMDVLYLIAAGITAYMGYETYQAQG